MKPNITPPIRTALLTQNGSPLSTGNGDIQTTRDWWMYWNQLGDQANANSQLVSDGAHADRPMPDGMPEGAIYIESDRGVIYQNQGGNWQYIAGTMYGTIAPDQRPTDLGIYDGGFEYRATDTDPANTGRDFIWSGTAWVETTPVLYGTHALRPLPAKAPARCLYVETDRGAIYQNQLGVWTYLAGTMWGTLVPDQRPTDLGVHDVGFDFRTNVPPPREFLWSQTAWVEITPAPQSPWASDIDGAGFTLKNVGKVGIGTSATPVYPLDVSGYAGGGYGGGNARFTSASTVTETGIHLVNTGTSGRDYAMWSTGGTSGVGVGYFIIADATAGATRFSIGPGGNCGIGMGGASFLLQLNADSAGKPGTSTWSVVSDIRLKQNISPVKDDSLTILRKLNWVRFEYNGQANMPRGMNAIGLIAQTLRDQLPEAVRSNKTKLNETDAEETDLLAIDYHHILVHSARAIQQLDAEVQALRALIGKSQP